MLIYFGGNVNILIFGGKWREDPRFWREEVIRDGQPAGRLAHHHLSSSSTNHLAFGLQNKYHNMYSYEPS
jgi:hypothetical protein